MFIINGRFFIDVERSELKDNTTGENNHLEPRLMKLLYLLIMQQGIIVKREFIVKEIWDDYPGANEGLNQAISSLRKLLIDEDKAIIQTHPKVGYSLNAVISIASEHKLLSGKKLMPLIIGALLLMALLLSSIYFYGRKNPSQSNGRQSNEKNDSETAPRNPIYQIKKIKPLLKDTLGPAAKGDSLRTQ